MDGAGNDDGGCGSGGDGYGDYDGSGWFCKWL